MLIVLDTNVLVSGILNGEGVPGRILDLVLNGQITVVFDNRILSEYAEVLARPEFKFDQGLVHAVLSTIELNGFPVEATDPIPALVMDDPSDAPFIEVALMLPAVHWLVTGNRKHYAKFMANTDVRPDGFSVCTPREFFTNYLNENNK